MDWMKMVMDAGEKLNRRKEITDPEEIRRIVELLTTGTEEKRPKAARHLARCYEHGFGVEKDFRKALELYRSCADGKDISSAYYVGYLMKYGPEEIRDEERSKYYLEKACVSCNENAIRSGRQLCRESEWFCIDFSPVHEVLLKNPDGSFSPMDEPFFESEEIAGGDYMILSSGDYSYVISDGKEGIAVDGGYGAGNIRKYMEKISGASVEAILNTHDHFDHTANNAYFDRAYMTEKTAKYAGKPFPSFAGIDFYDDVVDRRIVHEGDVLTVGSKHIEVVEIADHAPGSAMYLVQEDRLLLTGDEIFGFPMKTLNRSLEDWRRNMKKLEGLLDRVDLIYGGRGKLEKEYVMNFIRCAEYAAAHPEEAEDVPEGEGAPGPRGDGPERNEAGQIIYDRKMPHFGDRSVYEPEDTPDRNVKKKKIRYAGVTLTFPAE